jgi:hypothetical protein
VPQLLELKIALKEAILLATHLIAADLVKGSTHISSNCTKNCIFDEDNNVWIFWGCIVKLLIYIIFTSPTYFSQFKFRQSCNIFKRKKLSVIPQLLELKIALKGAILLATHLIAADFVKGSTHISSNCTKNCIFDADINVWIFWGCIIKLLIYIIFTSQIYFSHSYSTSLATFSSKKICVVLQLWELKLVLKEAILLATHLIAADFVNGSTHISSNCIKTVFLMRIWMSEFSGAVLSNF